MSKSFCLRACLVVLSLLPAVGIHAQTAVTVAGPAATAMVAGPTATGNNGAAGLVQGAAAVPVAEVPGAKTDTAAGLKVLQTLVKPDVKPDFKPNGKKGKPGIDGVQPPFDEPAKDVELEEIEFQRFVRSATGQTLRLFGFELFGAASNFSPVQAAPVPAGYILGPGDEIVVQASGAIQFGLNLLIDRDGRVMVPKMGPLSLAGVPLNEAEKVLSAYIGKDYRNFTISVTMGRLRSIEVFVLGQARKPGKHLVSSLSSLTNALFETGGPTSNGSLRAIELRRAGKKIATVDLYAFLARADNSADMPLLAGDIIFIPPAGARAALVGTINAPAIYELRSGETINNMLDMSGGLPTLAAPQKAQLERVEASRQIARYVEDFALDSDGLKRTLKAGDILTVFQISPQIANVVTLQGNVASPLRYNFKPGMKVSDLLSDVRLLIPGSYWKQINEGVAAGNYSRPEVNLDYATIQRLDPATLRTKIVAFNLRKAIGKDKVEDLDLLSGDIVTVYKPGEAGPETENSVAITGELLGGLHRFVWRAGFSVRDIIPSTQWLIEHHSYWQRPGSRSLKNDINWDYAQIIRQVPQELKAKAVVFNLGKAISGANRADNIELQAGDQITLFNQSQMQMPIQRRVVMVKVDGEVAVPGLYQAEPGETLPQLLKRVGGLTAQAYLYGTDFSRESVRAFQQQNLDLVVRKLEAKLQAQSAAGGVDTRSIDVASPGQNLQVQQVQQAQAKMQIEKLKSVKSNGRITLELDRQERSIASLPELPLEDGDRILVPTIPGFVMAVGAVNNESVYIYKPGKTVADVLKTASLTEDADEDNVFLLRADGSVEAKKGHGSTLGSWFSGSFASLPLMPGDTVVVPAKLASESNYSLWIRGFKDWTQILSNLGLGAAAIKTLK